MIVHQLNPTILDLGFFQLRWYSLFYLVGLAIAYVIIRQVGPKRGIKLSKDDAMDYIVYLAMGLLVGGRIGYFLFYNLEQLIGDPLELFRLWNGGMSFHGGLAGAFAGGAMFCRKKKIHIMDMADLTVIPLGLGLALGRFGNFINGELFGRPWDGFLCVDYTQNPHIGNMPQLCRYPSQLAEAGKNLVIFATMWMLKYRKLPRGFLFYLFLVMYGAMRFVIEFIRQPDPQLGFVLGPLTMGQGLSGAMFLFGSIMILRLAKLNKKPAKPRNNG